MYLHVRSTAHYYTLTQTVAARRAEADDVVRAADQRVQAAAAAVKDLAAQVDRAYLI